MMSAVLDAILAMDLRLLFLDIDVVTACAILSFGVSRVEEGVARGVFKVAVGYHPQALSGLDETFPGGRWWNQKQSAVTAGSRIFPIVY